MRLTCKAMYSNVRVLTAQHLKLDEVLRMAGVSKDAEEIAPDRFVFYTWPRLGRQLQLDEGRGYVRQWREVDLAAVTVNRWAAVDGCTAPPAARVGEDGVTVLQPPPRGGCARHGAAWKDRQWPDLMRVMHGARQPVPTVAGRAAGPSPQGP
jgi:hypothetical protein